MNTKQLKILQALEAKPLTAIAVAKQCGFLSWFLKAPQPPYAELEKMEAEGLVTSYFDEARLPERGGNRRRFYAITTIGRQELERIAAINANLRQANSVLPIMGEADSALRKLFSVDLFRGSDRK